jgi:uncharacterized MAPEG superfamily protein
MLVTHKQGRIVGFTLLTVFLFLILMSSGGGDASGYSAVFVVAYLVFSVLYLTFSIIKAVKESKSLRLREQRAFEDTFRNMT